MTKQKNILLVEDESIIALSEKMDLEKVGYKVILTYNGNDAIETIKTNPDIDLILIDIDLGKGINGIKTAEIIQKKWKIPILFLSSNIKTDITEKIENITSYGYVVKKNGITVLDTSIKMALKLFKQKNIEKDEHEKLRKINNQLAATINALPEIMFEIDSEGKIYNYHAPDPELLYTTPEKFLGKTIFEVLPSDVSKIIHESILKAIATGKSAGAVYSLQLPQGLSWFELSVAAIDDTKKTIVLIKDITKRKKTETKLNTFSLLINQTKEGVAIANLDSIITFVNKAWVKMHGYTENDKLVGKNLKIFYSKKQMQESITPFIKQLMEKGSYSNEVRNKQKDGSEFPTFMVSTVLKDEGGKPIAMAAIATDITQRKHLEQGLAQYRDNLEKLVEDKVKDFKAINEKLKVEISEKKKIEEELIDYKNHLENIVEVRTNKIQHVNIELKDEIEKRINIQAEIKKSREKYKHIVDNSPDYIMELTKNAVIVSINIPMAKYLGHNVQSLVGKNASEVFPEQIFQQRFKLMTKALNTNDIIHSETERNGRYFENIYVPSGNRETIQIIIRDKTKRKMAEKEKAKLETQMFQQAKLASLGEVATGIAHEINQPLTYINTVIQRIIEDIEINDLDTSIASERLKKSEQQVSRIKSIIDHLRIFGRTQNVIHNEVDLIVVLEDSLLIMSEKIRLKNIKLIKNIDNNLLKIKGNSNKLEQIFINLFSNAIDALKKKENEKELIISIRNSEDNSNVILQISDNGDGMSEEIRKKIFEPFYTTKKIGKGTGMGLSIIYGIVNEHGGKITCESEVGKGTLFSIEFPTKT